MSIPANHNLSSPSIESSNLRWQAFLQDCDVFILKSSAELLEPYFTEIIAQFYAQIEGQPELKNILSQQNIQANHLHLTFRKYLDTLFSGNYDLNYFEGRRKIGETHYKISLPLSWYQHTQEVLKWNLIRFFKEAQIKRSNLNKSLDISPEQFQNSLAKIMTVDLLTVTDSYINHYTADLQSAKKIAEDAAKAKDMILAAVSHDLRSPLFALTAFSDLLLEDKQLTHDSQNYAKAIHRNSNLLLQLVNNLLELIKCEHQRDGNPRMESVHLPTLLSELVEDTKALVKEKNITVEKIDHTLGSFAYMHTNPQYLHRILQNLLVNSSKFTHSGMIEIRCFFDIYKRQYHFQIRDSGRGISFKDQDSIFKEFFQVKNSDDPPGTGLGLPLSKSLARRMGGDLFLKDSTPGQGSCFELILPSH